MKQVSKYNNIYCGFLLIIVGGAIFVGNAVFGVLIIIGGILTIVLGTFFSRNHIMKLKAKQKFLQQYLHTYTPPLSQERMINSLFKETVRKKDLRVCPSCYSVFSNNFTLCNECERSLVSM